MLLALTAGLVLFGATVLGQTEPSCSSWSTGGGDARNTTYQCIHADGRRTGTTCDWGGGQFLCQSLTAIAPTPTVADILRDQQRGPPIPGRGGPRWIGDDGGDDGR